MYARSAPARARVRVTKRAQRREPVTRREQSPRKPGFSRPENGFSRPVAPVRGPETRVFAPDRAGFPRHIHSIRPGVPRWCCPDPRCSARHKARDTGVSGGSRPSALGFPRRPGTGRPVCVPEVSLAVAPRRPSRLPAASAPASHPGFRARPPAPRPRPRESGAFARLRAPTPRGASIFGAEF